MAVNKPSGEAIGQVSTAAISSPIPMEDLLLIAGFIEIGISSNLSAVSSTHDFFSTLIREVLSVVSIQGGRITCILSVKPTIINGYGGMHGGAVAAVAELVSIACARTLVPKEKELLLGEMSVSYLSAAKVNAKVIVEGRVMRSGRNLTFVAVEFKYAESEELLYTSHATFYSTPISRL